MSRTIFNVLLFLPIIFSFYCGPGGKNQTPVVNESGNQAIKLYKDKVRATADSIKSYDLDSTIKTLTKYLYILHGPRSIVDQRVPKEITFSECDVKFTTFSRDSIGNIKIYYTVFWQDSIPLFFEVQKNYNDNLSGYLIEPDGVINGIIAGTGSTDLYFDNVVQYCDSLEKSTTYITYLNSHRKKFHKTYLTTLGN